MNQENQGKSVTTKVSVFLMGVLALATAAQAAQVTDLKAVHRQGQTFLTWSEPDFSGSVPDLFCCDLNQSVPSFPDAFHGKANSRQKVANGRTRVWDSAFPKSFSPR